MIQIHSPLNSNLIMYSRINKLVTQRCLRDKYNVHYTLSQIQQGKNADQDCIPNFAQMYIIYSITADLDSNFIAQSVWV